MCNDEDIEKKSMSEGDRNVCAVREKETHLDPTVARRLSTRRVVITPQTDHNFSTPLMAICRQVKPSNLPINTILLLINTVCDGPLCLKGEPERKTSELQGMSACPCKRVERDSNSLKGRGVEKRQR